ncbi:MAG TPA: pantoate--beta-alanine ligase [Firmicutes bacterium]|nr:pantoate--beta-alanine ligase [Bacillota bacterium]
MQVVGELRSIREIIGEIKKREMTIGFVPTMGFLHEGHLSLIRRAKEENDFVVVSIFVNPLQFGVGEDFEQYPRDLERDKELAAAAGCDLLFVPAAKDMYQRGYATFVDVDRLTEGLCGASRPGHFRGVTTVVNKLFNLVSPHRAYFGQKDAQQALVLQRMIRDLNMDLELIILPTIRESDGLAMSSRNKYLSSVERKEASVLYRSLRLARELIDRGEKDALIVKKSMEDLIRSTRGAVLDYLEIVDTDELKPLESINGKCLVAVAVKFGATRLIDNIFVEV